MKFLRYPYASKEARARVRGLPFTFNDSSKLDTEIKDFVLDKKYSEFKHMHGLESLGPRQIVTIYYLDKHGASDSKNMLMEKLKQLSFYERVESSLKSAALRTPNLNSSAEDYLRLFIETAAKLAHEESAQGRLPLERNDG